MSIVACGESKEDTIQEGCGANNCSTEMHDPCVQVLLEECPEEQPPGNGSADIIKSEIIITPKTIIINEVSSTNSSFDDEDGDSPDWIELYNNGNTTIDLEGWSITDDSLAPAKWTFPAISLAANSYLQIWASDKDRVDPALHTNFKISSSGEEITLFDSNGTQIDYIKTSALKTDISMGRSPTDESIVYFEAPTPGSQNSNDSYLGQIQTDVVFSHEGGEFNGQSIELSGASEGEEIRYTLDATKPNQTSSLYTSPIIISQDTVIRAKIFKNNYIPSRTYSRTYITSNTHDLPIVTLVSEPDNFFDQQYGIYEYGPEEKWENEIPFFGANFWQDWERDIHFSFYEPTGELGVAIDAGVKIFGSWSRSNDQRSMSIHARGRYGFGKLEYPIFPSLNYHNFESIVLRSSGTDWLKTNIKDVVATSLMEGSGLEYQTHRSAVVYLNGEYWGFYNIREKVNEHFLDNKINVDKSEINILTRDGEIVKGSNTEYNQLIDFVTNNSMTDQSNYDYVASQVDIDNFITYQVAQIYLDNIDWPGNNIKFWNSPETNWRWILYDTDYAFGRAWETPPFDAGIDRYDNDTLSFALDPYHQGYQNPSWSTLLARVLMTNTVFKNKFINQFADEMNTRFKADNVRNHVNSIANSVSSEISRHFAHWSSWDNLSPYWQTRRMNLAYGDWQNELDKIIDFTDNRISSLAGYYRSYFGINGMFNLTLSINNTEAGSVQLNSLTIDTASWQGEYFDFIPVSLTAVPNEGYEFVGWQGSINQFDANATLTTSENASVQAIFQAIKN